MNNFSEVSLLITHYNRSKSLENLLKSFRLLNCRFASIVVSDDGSEEEHLKQIRELQTLYSFKLICAEENKGLGHNINKGQDAITAHFTLYVQEDFEPLDIFPETLREACKIMSVDTDFDFVRFYSYITYPYLKRYNNSFSEMEIKPFGKNYKKIYAYCDHPHLRRSSFFQKFGRYAEGLKGDRTEYRMCISFIQNKGKGLFYNDYKKLFIQKNTLEEPSTMLRSAWRNKDNIFISVIRYLYRQVKYNFDILMMKFPILNQKDQ